MSKKRKQCHRRSNQRTRTINMAWLSDYQRHALSKVETSEVDLERLLNGEPTALVGMATTEEKGQSGAALFHCEYAMSENIRSTISQAPDEFLVGLTLAIIEYLRLQDLYLIDGCDFCLLTSPSDAENFVSNFSLDENGRYRFKSPASPH